MKYFRFILIAMVVIFLVYFLFAVNKDEVENTQSPTQEEKTAQSSLEAKTDEQGQVTVKITPHTLRGGQWKFDVVLDTHSVDLDQDMMQVAELTDDKGNTYKPIAWEGATPGGHHREGILVFQSTNLVPFSVELKIKNIGGVPERSFKWNIQ